MTADDGEPEEGDDEARPQKIDIPPEWIPGVYANDSAVVFTPSEFTIDFIRLDPYRPIGVVVARLSLAADTARILAVHLAEQLQAWANWVLSESGGNGNGQAVPRRGPGSNPSP